MKHQQEWAEWKQRRFHTLKRWLRYLPTRASLKRNFIFRKFGRFFLDKYPELWSFAYGPMKAAYYAGWILTFLPVMGIQIPLSILLAICFKGNVMMLIALQMISNPFTVGFLWTFEYHIGKFFLNLLPIQNHLLHQSTLAIAHTGRGTAFVKATIAVCIGGTLLGLICAKISCIIHKRILKRTSLTYEQFVMLKEQKQKHTYPSGKSGRSLMILAIMGIINGFGGNTTANADLYPNPPHLFFEKLTSSNSETAEAILEK